MLRHIARSQPTQEPQFSVSHFGELPGIPWPSANLQGVLKKYDDTNKKQSRVRTQLKKRAPKVPKRKRLNGFTAFRSYYTKSILGVQSQKRLSSELAEIWKTEPSHNIWNSYALIYNATGGNETFVDWLVKSVGFIGENLEEHRGVEDVFLEGDDFKVVESQSFLY